MRSDSPEASARAIFISHAEEDSDIAIEIARGLESVGYSTWYYERDMVIGPPHLAQTARAIERCQAVILIISQPSVGSDEVDIEVQCAQKHRKPFAPILRDISYEAFQRARPVWDHVLGAAVAAPIGPEGVAGIIPRLVGGLRFRDVIPEGVKGDRETTRASAPSRTEEAEARRRAEEEANRARAEEEARAREEAYLQAQRFYDEGSFTAALDRFQALAGYRDSPAKAESCRVWLSALERLRARDWDGARGILDRQRQHIEPQRAAPWKRACLVAARLVPALESLASGSFVRDPAVPWEGGECPYQALASVGASPATPMAALLDLSFTVQAKPGGMTREERDACDALRLLEKRLLVDFGLYRGRDPARAAAALQRLCAFEEGSDPSIKRERIVADLGEDAGVFLALVASTSGDVDDYKAAIQCFLAQARENPWDPVPLHHLGLAAAAMAHRLDERGGDEGDLSEALERLILGWGAIFAHTDFWQAWWYDRRSLYDAALDRAMVESARAGSERFWMDRIAAIASSIPEMGGIEVTFMVELAGARAVQAGGGIPLPGDTGRRAVVGPLGARELGLLDAVSQWSATLEEGDLEETARGQQMRRCFSELGPAAALYRDGRFEEALGALGHPRCELQREGHIRCRHTRLPPDVPRVACRSCPEFAHLNPAFAGLAHGADLLMASALDLAEQIHLKAAMEAVSTVPTDVDQAVTHWETAVRLAARHGCAEAVIHQVRQIAIGRSSFLCGERREKPLDGLNDAVTLMEEVYDRGWADPEGRTRDALVHALLCRALYLSNELDDEKDARSDALRALSLAPASLKALHIFCQTSLFYAKELHSRGQLGHSQALVQEVAMRLSDGETRFPGNADLATCRQNLEHLRKLLAGRPGEGLARTLKELAGADDTTREGRIQRWLVEAMVKSSQQQFEDAVGIYDRILSEDPENPHVLSTLPWCYREWIFHATKSGELPLERIREIAREALARFPSSDALSDIAQQFQDDAE